MVVVGHVTLVAWFAALVRVQAMPQYAALLPNGDKFENSGPLGHYRERGGGALTDFGKAFLREGLQWTSTLCHEDSDEDGLTNGEELGDPCCLWDMNNDEILRTVELSNPGNRYDVAKIEKTDCTAFKKQLLGNSSSADKPETPPQGGSTNEIVETELLTSPSSSPSPWPSPSPSQSTSNGIDHAMKKDIVELPNVTTLTMNNSTMKAEDGNLQLQQNHHANASSSSDRMTEQPKAQPSGHSSLINNSTGFETDPSASANNKSEITIVNTTDGMTTHTNESRQHTTEFPPQEPMSNRTGTESSINPTMDLQQLRPASTNSTNIVQPKQQQHHEPIRMKIFSSSTYSKSTASVLGDLCVLVVWVLFVCFRSIFAKHTESDWTAMPTMNECESYHENRFNEW